MADFAVKPDELAFMTKYSNAESEEEKLKLKKEYDAQVKAYLSWLDNANKKK
jgi:hypothetical protein